jgi:hypothetical protein
MLHFPEMLQDKAHHLSQAFGKFSQAAFMIDNLQIHHFQFGISWVNFNPDAGVSKLFNNMIKPMLHYPELCNHGKEHVIK